MSYEIFYDRKFVKTTRGIIPMVLHGSNNCFDVKCDARGRTIEVAERSWSVLAPQREIELPSEELLSKMQKMYGDNEYEFGKYHSKWILNKDVREWYKAGVKSAQTLEDYIMFNPYLSMYGELRVYAKDGHDCRSNAVMRESFHTTAELENWIDRATSEIKKINGDVYPCLQFSGQKPLKSVSKIAGPVVAKGKYGYISEYKTDKSVTYDKDRSKAIVFDDMEDAIKKIGRRWDLPRFLSATTVIKPKPYVIGVSMTNGSCYSSFIQNKTSRRLFLTGSEQNAIHFASRKTAENYIEDLKTKFSKTNIRDMIVIDVSECA